MTRGRNSGSPVARGYQILLWATRKKTSCSPLGYQTLWLYCQENQQSAVRICSKSLIAQQCQSAELAHPTAALDTVQNV